MKQTYQIKVNDIVIVNFDGGASPKRFCVKRSSTEPFVILQQAYENDFSMLHNEVSLVTTPKKTTPRFPMKCDNCGETDMVDMAPNGKFCMESFWSFEHSKCEKCEKFTMNPVTEGSLQ